jgi:hypothetical protein
MGRPPTISQRFLRGISGLALSIFLWSNFVMIPFGFSFFFVDDPFKALRPVGLEFAGLSAFVASWLSIYFGGMLGPMVCSYSQNRFRWMIFFYSLAGAMLSLLLACSLSISAALLIQQTTTWRPSEYVPYVMIITAILAGLLGGYLSAIFLNKRWKTRTNLT